MKKRNFFSLFIGLLMMLGLTACGKKTLENVIVGRWQDPEDGNISCFNEDGSYELDGEQIGYYSVEKDHLEIYLYDSRIPATKLYGDVELNGDDYFSGYMILEDEDGETVAEENTAFVRLGNTEVVTENEDSGDLTLEDVIVGETWRTDNRERGEDLEFTFLENGRYVFNGVDAGSYTVTGNTLEVIFDVKGEEGRIVEQIEVQNRDELVEISYEEYNQYGKEISVDDDLNIKWIRVS